MNAYNKEYLYSIQEPEKFWQSQAQELSWHKFPNSILSENEAHYPQWFADGELNMSYLCIDKHIQEGHGDQLALIYDSPVSQTQESYSFQQLKTEVEKLAAGLQDLGFAKGDTAIIYMPMIPQAVFSMLACARLGIIHSVVFGGFAANELALRIDDCQAKFVLTASVGIEIDKKIAYMPLIDSALEQATHAPEKVIVYDRKLGEELNLKSNQLLYTSILKENTPVPPVMVTSTHPLYILYTSGTTGKPKGIVRDTGGYATALKYSMKAVYNVPEGQVYWAASDVGWVVGHSYIVYGPLLNRNTTILFEGKPIKTPNAGTFWRIISEYKVHTLFTAPTAIRAIKKEDFEGNYLKEYDLSSLKSLFLAGERCDVATLEWCQERLQIPIIDHWWQTASGWPMIADPMGIEPLPVKPGSVTKAVPGYNIQILNPKGEEVPAQTEGLVCVKLPLPPGTLLSIWGNPKRFKESYLDPFPGYYFSGDGGYKDPDDYLYITGRVDDIINVAGHRLSTSDMEEIVSSHMAVAECAVFGIEDELKGHVPLALIVKSLGNAQSLDTIEKEIVQEIRNKIGAIASLKKVIEVQRLPKTRSGKILRNVMRNMADGKEYTIPSTIDDPLIIEEILIEFKNHNII